MASTSSSHRQNAFSGIEPPNKRRKIEESSRVYDVFINHRGPDVKKTLATQLYNSLKALGISAFLDSEEKELGNSFTSIIEAAVRSASVHIGIFSKRYAESAWCLAELDLMLQTNTKIIPVFYQVEPWELRYIEKGVYAEAFRLYQEKGRYLDKLEDWKEALQTVSYTAGVVLNPDSIDCKDIVSAVEKEVKRKEHLYVAKYPVGLHKLVRDFERRCLGDLVKDFERNCRMKTTVKGKANVFGIFGMGGVGKTTLSKELFNQKISKYTRASFLFHVREACASGRLPSLQSKLLKDIFGKDQDFHSSEEGTSRLRYFIERSRSLSFLIVLDDIDHVEQLESLLVMDMLKKFDNNLVIVTTRNVGVLVSAGIDIGYHLKGLDGDDGRELFCWHAFGQPHPDEGYEDLVQNFVNVCGGLPLSLIVLGRHVSGRDQWYWQDELEKVKESLPTEIKKRLEISIGRLDDLEKQMFMDIACFFIGKPIKRAMLIWEGSGWRARVALQTLKERCLVEEEEYPNNLSYKWESTLEGSAFRMHDHLRDLGREMADELNFPRRVWRAQDLNPLESKGFKNILTQTKSRIFHSIVDKSIGCRITYFVGQPKDGSDASLLWIQLEYLSWPQVNLRFPKDSSIPLWIPLQNLQCLRISNGCLRKLWQSNVQAPSNLRELQIHGTYLEEFPNLLGKLRNMDKLVLHAKGIQTDIRSLLVFVGMNLRSLRLIGSELEGGLGYNVTAERKTPKSLVIYDFEPPWKGEFVLNNEEWSRTVMSNVENLEINGYELVMKILIDGNCCQRLKSLKICEMKNLVEADLARIKTLNCLEITNCENLKIFSATSDLCNLVELKISKCLELEELWLAHLSCLEKLTIENCNYLKRLSGISNLAKLVELNISDSHALDLEEVRFAQISCLEKDTIGNCNHLRKVPRIYNIAKLVELAISGCQMLEFECLCLRDMKHLKTITFDRGVKVKYFELDSCANLRTVMFSCKNTVNLTIRYCQDLDKLADLKGPSCLKRIIIDGCGNLKYLRLDGLENLESLSGNMELRHLKIDQCPALEELPSLARMNSLEKIHIQSCGKLQSIILPSMLVSVSVECCRDLQSIEGIADLTKLTYLGIEQCPALEELPSLARLICLEEIGIHSCEKLQSIILPSMPSMLLTVSVNCCKDLQNIEGIADLTKLRYLYIEECPALEELPSLARLSRLEDIKFAACEKLQNIAGFEELPELKYLALSYCSNALIRNCIHKLKFVPSIGLFIIGKAVPGAESILNENLFGDANIGVQRAMEIDTRQTRSVWSELSANIECYVVSSEYWHSKEAYFSRSNHITKKECKGEWVMTMISRDGQRHNFQNQFEEGLISCRITEQFRVKIKKGEQWKCVDMLRTIVDRLHIIYE